MKIELKQQLSNLLDESPGDNLLDDLLQELHREKDLRNLYSRYLLIGAVMRSEQVNIASLHISEQIRPLLFNVKTAPVRTNFSFTPWFNYTSTWLLAIYATILIIVIGFHTVYVYKNLISPSSLLAQNRHFWPGTIMLDKNQNLSKYKATLWQKQNKLYNNVVIPVQYNNLATPYQ